MGGPAQHVIHLAHGLRPEFETVLVSGTESAGEGNMLDLAAELGVQVTRIPELGREIDVASDAVALLKLVRLVRRERPDIIHTHTAKAGVVGRLAAKLCGTPLVLHTFHGNVFHGYFGPRKTRVFIALERALARGTDRIIALNVEQRQELLRYGIAQPNKIGVLKLGLPLEALAHNGASPAILREKWGVPNGNRTVGIVGRLVPIKGHELFIDMAARVQRERAGVSFVVVGDGERRQELEQYAAGVGAKVIFTGFEADRPAIFAALDVVALTSINEGSPVALIEAMAARRPVISTAAGGVVDLVHSGETGLVLPSRDPSAFAEALLRLLDEPAEARRLAEAG
ncbi:MAG: glycosyltransferase, partial [Chloroflexota bacterium]